MHHLTVCVFTAPAGANVGFTSLLLSLLYPDATIVSVEPDPGNFAQLQKNVAG